MAQRPPVNCLDTIAIVPFGNDAAAEIPTDEAAGKVAEITLGCLEGVRRGWLRWEASIQAAPS